MRLTLRTLLAWLDGVLPGDEQVQLGEKVSASQTASLLAERIRLAVTRPTIAAPAAAARGLADDANSVAEFLDNTLSAEQLATFEKICLESDMHLAEVAACHTMLAAMARQPAANPAPAVGQRLRKLVHDSLGQQGFGAADGDVPRPIEDGHKESRETARALRAALGPHAADVGGGANEAGSAGGPALVGPGGAGLAAGTVPSDRLPSGESFANGGLRDAAQRRSSRQAWWSALIAAALVVALCGVLGWSAFRGSGRRGTAHLKAGGEHPGAVEPAPAPPIDAVAAAAPAVADTKDAAGDGGGPAMPPAAAAPAADGPRAGTADPDAPPQPNEPPAAAVNAAARMAVGGSAAMEPSATAAVRPGGTDTQTIDANAPSPLVVVGGPLLRLTKQDGGDEWQYAAPGTSVLPGDELIVPPWSEAKLTAGSMEISLLALTDVSFLTDRDGTPRLDVLFGRCSVGGGAASRIGITVGGLTGVIETGPATRVTIEVGMDRPGTGDADAASAAGAGFITAGQRPFTWQATAADGSVPADATPVEVAAGSAVVWRNGRASRDGVPASVWADASGFSERVQKAAADTLVATISAGKPLLLSLREMTAARRIENRMLAAATLALIGHADELVELLEATPESRGFLEDQQWQTLERLAVPATLARGGEASAALHRALISGAPPGEADRLWAMARGFSDADIAGGGDRVLVEKLDAPNLMVRRYAYKTLCDITRPTATDRLRYRADALPERRREGLTWWQGQLERGLIHR